MGSDWCENPHSSHGICRPSDRVSGSASVLVLGLPLDLVDEMRGQDVVVVVGRA